MKLLLCLSALVIATSAAPAFALSCVAPSLKTDLAKAATVFEGRLVKIERGYEIDPDASAGGHVERATYIVDRSWKGAAEEGDHVHVLIQEWMPLDPSARDWPETAGEETKVIAALASPKDGEAGVYEIGLCGAAHYEATAENLKTLQQAFPAAAR